MNVVSPQKLTLKVDSANGVSALLLQPLAARACFVFAHGAGAGMSHRFMEQVAGGLCDRGIATLRYQFPYMERASRRPDPPAIAHAAVRAAVEEAARCCAGLALVAGGKSFGGRMTSQAQAIASLASVRGLAFLGFPLHPAGKPSDARAKHLSDVDVPMLFNPGHPRQACGAAAD
jgi:predicted alpha/beta-hydrolase family hydrolase